MYFSCFAAKVKQDELTALFEKKMFEKYSAR